MNHTKIEALKKLYNYGYVEKKDLKKFNLTMIEEILYEEMRQEKEINDKIIHELRLCKVLLKNNILFRRNNNK